MKKNKEGFTLIELLTVIAILGILVLLAAPKFLGYTEKANIAKIQTGIKAVETAIDLKYIENPNFTEDWVVLSPDKLQEINDSGKLIDKNGFIKENLDKGKHVPLKDLDVKWHSGGEFIINEEDASVYYYNKDINVSKNPDDSETVPGNNDEDDSSNNEPPVTEPEINYPIIDENGNKIDEDGTITKPDGTIVKPDGTEIKPDGSIIHPDGSVSEKQPDGNLLNPDGSVTLPDGSIVPVATDSDFTWINDPYGNSAYNVPGKEKGYYKYTGTKKSISLPNKIEGNTLTSYYRMFDNSDVSKVINYNEGITSMESMFYHSKANSLDLSTFKTSNVTNMSGMFNSAQSTTLDLSSFDTSKVKDISFMFVYSKSTTLNLSSFNTTDVINMESMFRGSQATALDLSNFITHNVENVSGMFWDSKATTLNVSSFDISKVNSLNNMFRNSQATILDLSSFNTSNVTSMSSTFADSKATIGYARTITDASKLNASSNKPTTFTFTTK